MWDPVTEVWMSFRFPQVKFYFVFDVVDVDELDVKLAVKMFYTHRYVMIGFSRSEIVQFVFQLVDLFAVRYQYIMPLMTLIND